MRPDGDALGSSAAMYHFLNRLGKQPKVVLNDTYPANLSFLVTREMSDDLFVYEQNPEGANHAIIGSNLIICLDFNAFHRTDKLEAPLSGAHGEKILIDHHLNPSRELFKLSFSETEVSSASELLYHILMHTSYIDHDAHRLGTKCAEALLTGMTTDTNNFANSVYPSTLRMTASLIEAGVDRDMIVSNIYQQHRETRMRLMGYILKDLMTITPDGVAYIILDKKILQDYYIEEGDTEGFVNIPLSIANVTMSILVKEDESYARVSIRSKEGTSANQCSRRYFNGGGHENAAGGRLYFGKDITDITKAAEYIETHTHIFMNEDNN
jgi:phosphoesterase RecJ-like protein